MEQLRKLNIAQQLRNPGYKSPERSQPVFFRVYCMIHRMLRELSISRTAILGYCYYTQPSIDRSGIHLQVATNIHKRNMKDTLSIYYDEILN